MNQLNPERKSNSESHEHDSDAFADKLGYLLPGIEFEEPTEMQEARKAVLEALTRTDQNPEFLRFVWTEYAKVCELVVDSRTRKTDIKTRAKLHVAALVHKALIYRESGNVQRYGEYLNDAKDYAFNVHLDEIDEIIGIEINSL